MKSSQLKFVKEYLVVVEPSIKKVLYIAKKPRWKKRISRIAVDKNIILKKGFFMDGSEKHIALEIEPLNSEQSCVLKE